MVGLAGYVEDNEEPYETAIKEISAEVGLEKEEIRLIKTYGPINISDSYKGEKFY